MRNGFSSSHLKLFCVLFIAFYFTQSNINQHQKIRSPVTETWRQLRYSSYEVIGSVSTFLLLIIMRKISMGLYITAEVTANK